jgi:hypothetical protein
MQGKGKARVDEDVYRLKNSLENVENTLVSHHDIEPSRLII